MIRLIESLHKLEEGEEQLRLKVSALTESDRRNFYQRQSGEIKDPDTYASLNYLLIGGFHHLYLGRHLLFTIEIILLICAIAFYFANTELWIYILIGVVVFELPQLFYSQRIARQRNLQISMSIYTDITSARVS